MPFCNGLSLREPLLSFFAVSVHSAGHHAFSRQNDPLRRVSFAPLTWPFSGDPAGLEASPMPFTRIGPARARDFNSQDTCGLTFSEGVIFIMSFPSRALSTVHGDSKCRRLNQRFSFLVPISQFESEEAPCLHHKQLSRDCSCWPLCSGQPSSIVRNSQSSLLSARSIRQAQGWPLDTWSTLGDSVLALL